MESQKRPRHKGQGQSKKGRDIRVEYLCLFPVGVFALVSFLHLRLKSNNYISGEESSLWNVFYTIHTDSNLFDQVFFSSGLALNNLITLPIHLLKNVNILTPYFFALSFFVVFIFSCLLFLKKNGVPFFESVFFFVLGIINLPMLFVLSSQPYTMFSVICVVFSLVGLHYLKNNELVRAVLTLSIALSGAFLSGEITIVYALSLMMLLSLANQSSVLRVRPQVLLQTLGMFLVLLFLSVLYVSWLYKYSPAELLFFKRGRGEVIGLAIPILFFTYDWWLGKESKFQRWGARYYVSLSCLFTLVFLLAFKWNFYLESFAAVFFFTLLFKTALKTNSFKRKAAGSVILFLLLQLYSVFGSNSYEFESWKSALVQRFQGLAVDDRDAVKTVWANKEVKTLFLTKKINLFNVRVAGVTENLFPFTQGFALMTLNQISSFERIVLERPRDSNDRGLLRFLQNIVDEVGHPEFTTVFENPGWKVLQKNPFGFSTPDKRETLLLFPDPSIFFDQMGLFLLLSAVFVYLIALSFTITEHAKIRKSVL